MPSSKLSLRSRIFFYMILLVVLASILIAGVTVYQYREQSIDYHENRLLRKESQVVASVEQVLTTTTYPLETAYLEYIFKDEIYMISEVQDMDLNIYDLDGNLIVSSIGRLDFKEHEHHLSQEILKQLNQSPERRYIQKQVTPIGRYQSLFIYLTDSKFKPLGILNLPYLEDDSFNDYELVEFLKRLVFAYILMIILAIVMAYFVSKYITRSLQHVSDQLDQTRVGQRNEKLSSEGVSPELRNLVEAYNSMVDDLEESAAKLARGEREQAWREMAKQVAHEIKNPLTPMRLTIQSFEQSYDPKKPKSIEKVREFSRSLIQQIDTLSSIAEAFSNFAKMPAQKKETLNVVETSRLALELFGEDYISFSSEHSEIIARLDRTQLIRVITNLVKNAIQALQNRPNPKIEVHVTRTENKVIISINDNGPGIAVKHRDLIFEPKFTTKTSGMGLGLPMVKNIVETYGGSIRFESIEGEGTFFEVIFPLEEI